MNYTYERIHPRKNCHQPVNRPGKALFPTSLARTRLCTLHTYNAIEGTAHGESLYVHLLTKHMCVCVSKTFARRSKVEIHRRREPRKKRERRRGREGEKSTRLPRAWPWLGIASLSPGRDAAIAMQICTRARVCAYIYIFLLLFGSPACERARTELAYALP